MEKVLADAFLNFYQKMLKPEFDDLKEKQTGHDERLSEVLGHLDSIYVRLGILEEGYSEMNGRLKLIEGSIESCNISRSEMERRVKDIKEQFTEFQSRLESVERHLRA
jgi:predicted nuclease with TOPRIM domain